MTDRYQQTFKTLKEAGHAAFIPFTLLGWPDKQKSLSIIKTLIDAGASALELGFAFSDPVADGPIIQAAAFKTIEAGFTLDDCFALLRQVRDYNNAIPIGLLVYYNTVLSRGIDRFYREAAEAGVDSILIADLTVDSADEIAASANSNGIAPVFIISPLTDELRLRKLSSVAGGYVYVVSRLGITGTHDNHDTDLHALLSRARANTKLPLCVGFGISTPEHAQKMISFGADGVITGSRIIQMMTESSDLSKLEAYVQGMVQATKSVPIHR